MVCATLSNNKQLMMAGISVFILLTTIITSCYVYFSNGLPYTNLDASLPNSSVASTNSPKNGNEKNTSDDANSILSALVNNLLVDSDEHKDQPHTQSEESQNKNHATTSSSIETTVTGTTTVTDTTVSNVNQTGNIHFIDETDNEDTSVEMEGTKFMSVIKITSINKTEEVFEDLLAQNIHRIITENRLERLHMVNEEEVDDMESDIEFQKLMGI